MKISEKLLWILKRASNEKINFKNKKSIPLTHENYESYFIQKNVPSAKNKLVDKYNNEKK